MIHLCTSCIYIYIYTNTDISLYISKLFLLILASWSGGGSRCAWRWTGHHQGRWQGDIIQHWDLMAYSAGYVYRYRLKKPATAISQKIGVSENGGLTPKLESPEKDEDDKPLDLGVSYFRTGRHINWVQIWQGITVINSILKSWNLELVNPRKYHLVMTNIAMGNDGPNRNRWFTYQ